MMPGASSVLRPSVPAVKTSGILEAADVEVAFLRREGKSVWAEIRASSHRDAAGLQVDYRLRGWLDELKRPELGDMETWTERLGHTQLRSFTDKDGHFWQQNPAKTSKWAKLVRRP
jgi:hypothetical protein